MRRTLLLVIAMMLLSACGDSGAPDSNAGEGQNAGQGSQVDLATINACSFLGVAKVQAITGEDVRFTDSGRADPSSSRCFWGASVPGVPAYVEVMITRYRGDLTTGVDADCTVSDVAVKDADSAGVTCPPDPQRKISLLAGVNGIRVSLLVNEPSRPLTPKDLVPFVESIVETL